MRALRFLLIALLCIAVLGAGAGGAYLWFVRTVTGPGPLAAPVTIVIQPGAGLKGIAKQLADAGVVDAAWMAELEARRSAQARALKTGEYRFEAGISLHDALGKIVRRDVVAHFLTIPEGLTIGEVLRLVNTAEALHGDVAEDVAEALHDGDVLPETYRYEWGDTRTALIARMRQARESVLADLWAKRPDNLPLKSPAEALVLASVIEKETGIAAERPKVAAVFVNRLRRSMRLQSDPTVAYGIAPQGLDRSLTHADLAQPTPFNTYTIDGLPPSPICNPGRASIAAALNPADTSDLYFVADGSGGHAFAASLDDHNRNVARWRVHQHESAD